MQNSSILLGIILWWIIWLFIGYLIWKIVKSAEVKKHRKDAVRKSRSVILWEVAEKVAPLIPQIPYNPKDMTFIWKWVDYIVFDGLSNWNLKQIVFLEIKTGKSKQNNNEKQVEKIIKLKKVKYELKNL